MPASFTIPKGFSAPDGVKEGNEFSEIAKFIIKGDMIHVISIGQDETPIESKSEKPKGAKDSMKEHLKAMSDKGGSAKMGDSESPEEEAAPEEEMD